MAFKNIIVPIDFSDCSINALKVAIDLAQRTGSNLNILHCFNDPVIHDGLSPGNYQEEEFLKSRQDAEKEFEALSHLLPELDQVEHRFILSPHGVEEAVMVRLENNTYDIVIMGTRGASGLKGALFGSHTFHIAKNAKCPVLAVPEVSSGKINLAKVMLATDLHEEEAMTVYEPLRYLAEISGSELHFVHVAEEAVMSDSRTDAAWQLENYFEATEHAFHFRFEEETEEALLHYIEEKGIDLMVTVKRKRPFLEQLFHKSLTKKLSFHTHIPYSCCMAHKFIFYKLNQAITSATHS